MVLESEKRNQMGKSAKNVVVYNVLLLFFMALYNFFAPKLLTVEQYAYIKNYDLYINYAGLFHLGFINGIYLKFGNYNYEQLPKGEFRLYSRFLFLFQIILSCCLYLIVNLLCNRELILRVIVFICINIVLVNVTCFFSLINQFTCRFIFDSKILCIKILAYFAITLLVIKGILYDYKGILYCITVMNLSVLLANAIYNRHLIWGDWDFSAIKKVFGYFKNGIFVMFGELIALVVLAIDSLFVSNLFDDRKFAVYSFAVAVISLLYMIINTVSSLIYPYLVRIPKDKYAYLYKVMSGITAVIGFVMLISMAIIRWVIPVFIPEYKLSISIIYILLPTVLYKSLMTLVSGNFYKALNMPKKLFVNNVFGLVVAIAMNCFLYLTYKSISAIAIGSVITFIIWMFVTDMRFCLELKLSISYIIGKNTYLLLGIGAFYFCFANDNYYTLILYIIFIVVFSFLLFKLFYREKLEQ